MAGTITVSTISDGTNSTSSTNCIQGSAKAWVTFGGGASSWSAGAIQASYNVSSITVSGTGRYQVNFTNAFSDNKYCVGLSSSYFNWIENLANLATTSCKVSTVNTSAAYVNTDMVYFSAFR